MRPEELNPLVSVQGGDKEMERIYNKRNVKHSARRVQEQVQRPLLADLQPLSQALRW